MKKMVVWIAALAAIALLAFGYLRIGEKASSEAAAGMQQSQGEVNTAKQAVDAVNRNTETTKRALEQATGQPGH